MDNNGGSNPNGGGGGGGGGNDNTDSIVAMVALLVSVIALLIAIMQALQQYFASAQGYSQCSRKVMGEWASSRSRTFRWSELRFEVQFDTPVIFISPPTNDKGPQPGEDIFFLDGSKESCQKTWTYLEKYNDKPSASTKKPIEEPKKSTKKSTKKSDRDKIITADNERASWHVLLCTIQQMECDSADWQNFDYGQRGPPKADSHDYHRLENSSNPNPPLLSPPKLYEHHTMTVAIQRKRKSWDTMPPAITKPYATTTMCHLIEMMGALGVYWKEFDRKRDRYWAEGNGLLVLGERVSDLGIMFSAQVTGKSQFQTNRVIPVDEIKELCFGHVPTIYRVKADRRRVDDPLDNLTDLRSLLVSSRAEIAETLTVIGCNQKTVRYFEDESARISHIFPVSFEIIGMLSQTFHIPHSGFTYIPNPTPDVLDQRAFNFSKVLRSFRKLLRNGPNQGFIPQRLRYNVHHIDRAIGDGPAGISIKRYQTLAALHNALDDADQILTGIDKEQRQKLKANEKWLKQQQQQQQGKQQRPNGTATIDPSVLEEMMRTHKRIEARRDKVMLVLSHHIQKVMELLNPETPRVSETQSSPESTAQEPAKGSFEAMNVAGLNHRPKKFMEFYFESIRNTLDKIERPNSTQRQSKLGDSKPEVEDSTLADSAATSDADSENGSIGSKSLLEHEPSYDDIWCTLVFRMICWLMLHNFDRNDVQLPKSELLGSRMPVYIS